MSVSWLNPAGGLRYHVRAYSSRRLWAPFTSAVGAWLLKFQPRVKRAVFVGPSAAYSFPDAFLRQFSEISVLEPDPIARWLLLRRLRGLGISVPRVEAGDLLLRPLISGGGGLAELLAAEPDLTLIFGNLLGQTRFLLSEADFECFKAGFHERIGPLLLSRSWLSLHDRFSGNLRPSFTGSFLSGSRLSDAKVLSDLYASERLGAVVELFDHQSGGFFPSQLPHAYFSWQIDSARHHLVEAVFAEPR